MAGFSELIKNYAKTRDYVREFFIYGFKSRNDFDKKSARTYDDEKRRIESWLGDYITVKDSTDGRKIAITADSSHIHENPLYQAFYSKSFTDNDIKLHFLITDILSDGESLNLKEITEKLNENYDLIFDEQTVRNKLKEYVNEGIFTEEKIGKTAYFSLSSDKTENYFKKYRGFDDAVKFFSEAYEFGVIGNSILRDMKMKNEIFLRKHNFIVHTLEDIILTEILSAIDEKRYIEFDICSIKKRTLMHEKNFYPIRIFTSETTGRRYLIGYSADFSHFGTYRLDFITTVKAGELCENSEEINELFKTASKRCFGVSMNENSFDETPQPLEITLKADENTEAYIIDRIKREKRNGSFEKTGKNTFRLVYDVADPNEIMKWLKSFTGRIVSVKGGTNGVRERFYDDVKRMYEIYGGSK